MVPREARPNSLVALRGDAEALTPVIGTILILAISVIGIGAVLYWGAPMIEDVQQRTGQTAVEGAFGQVRATSSHLVGVGASEGIGLPIPGGTVSIADGGALALSASHEASCGVALDGWSDGDATLSFTTNGTCSTLMPGPLGACALADPCPRVYKVNGTVLTEVTIVTITANSVVLAESVNLQDDWLFRIQNQNASTIYSQHWILQSDALSWQESGQNGGVGMHLQWGVVLRQFRDAHFVSESFQVTEDAFQSGDFFWRIPTIQGPERSLSGDGNHRIIMRLDAISPRIQGDVAQLSLEWNGPRADAMCDTAHARNLHLTTHEYSTCQLDASDNSYATTYPVSPVASMIEMEVIHAVFAADLQP